MTHLPRPLVNWGRSGRRGRERERERERERGRERETKERKREDGRPSEREALAGSEGTV
jgi:hypothetical protein